MIRNKGITVSLYHTFFTAKLTKWESNLIITSLKGLDSNRLD